MTSFHGDGLCTYLISSCFRWDRLTGEEGPINPFSACHLSQTTTQEELASPVHPAAPVTRTVEGSWRSNHC